MNTTNASATGTRQICAGLKKTALRTASATAILLATTLAAHAQAQLAAAAPEVTDEIIVTGSRIVRDGYEAPTPLTVVGVAEIESSASANVADFVNTIPAFAGSRTPGNTNSSMSAGTSGMNAVNLRNIGLERTLVLVNGQRSIGSSSEGVVDVNTIPQALISRVDIVTGGASAAYGSDAVAGVVNFVLDTEFTGLKGEVGGEITTYGDNESWDFDITYGTPFAAGRGHFIISGSMNDVAGVPVNDRPWNLEGWQILQNPLYGTGAGQSRTVPERVIYDQSSVSNGIIGGIITSGPLKGIAFGEGGRSYPFPYGPIVSDPVMVGGGWQAATIRGKPYANSLTSAVSTENIYLRTSYDLTDRITGFISASWTHNKNNNWCCMKEDNASLTLTIDNPYLPADVRARAVALGVTSFVMGSMHSDFGLSGAINDRRVQRYVAGLEGTFDAAGTEWKWDAYYQKGIAHLHQEVYNVMRRSRFAAALNPTSHPVTGLPVCRINVDANPANDDPLCVPYNVFGINVNSPAAIDYLRGGGDRDFRTEAPELDVMAASVSGSPFELWAGPVSLAFGAEHRIDKIKGVNDPVGRAFDWYFGNYQVFTAKSSVTEGFVETVVPLATDESFAKSLEFNGAVRATDYSTSGYVTTWKVGLTWAPIDDIRFRATRSRDIRAPNLQNLFNTGTSGFPGYQNPFRRDPVTGGPVTEVGFSQTGGNPNLTPEKSDMTGVGVVLQPAFIPGFSASVDYWNLDVADALGSLTVQQIIDQCFATNDARFCSAIDFGANRATDPIQLIRIQPFNLATQIYRGIDIEAGYNMPLDMLLADAGGDLSFRFMATHYIKAYQNTGLSKPTDTAGQNNGTGAVPNWRWRASAGYTNETVSLSLTARGITSGTYLNSNVECTTGCPISTADNRTVDNNRIAGAVYLDTSMSYKFGVAETDMEVFFNVKNVLNTEPAVVAPGPGGFTYEAPAANATLYDTLGRVFRAGVRFRM